MRLKRSVLSKMTFEFFRGTVELVERESRSLYDRNLEKWERGKGKRQRHA